MLKAIPIALCIYSGIIEAGYEKRAVDQTLVGKIPVVNPKKPIHHFGSGSVTNPVPLVQTTPNYPKDALDKKLTGKVWLKGTIRKDGSVSIIQVLRYPEGGESLIKAAMKEVTQNWKFKPEMLNGEPVDVLTTIKIEFNLN